MSPKTLGKQLVLPLCADGIRLMNIIISLTSGARDAYKMTKGTFPAYALQITELMPVVADVFNLYALTGRIHGESSVCFLFRVAPLDPTHYELMVDPHADMKDCLTLTQAHKDGKRTTSACGLSFGFVDAPMDPPMPQGNAIPA